MIVFENLHSYLRLNKRNRELLDRYCQQYGAGIILFSPPAEETVFDSPLIGIPDLTYSTNVRVKVRVDRVDTFSVFALSGKSRFSLLKQTVFPPRCEHS